MSTRSCTATRSARSPSSSPSAATSSRSRTATATTSATPSRSTSGSAAQWSRSSSYASGSPVRASPTTARRTPRTRAAPSRVDGVKITLTDANHSSSAPDGSYTGESCGIVLELEDGFRIYFAGDTNVFGDMSLIGRIYAPDVAVLADRRPLHDGTARGRRRARAPRSRPLRAVSLRHVRASHRHA